jgi:hypothetical protein
MKQITITWCIDSGSSPYFPQHVARYKNPAGETEDFDQILCDETEEEFFLRVETKARMQYGNHVKIAFEHDPYLAGCPL